MKTKLLTAVRIAGFACGAGLAGGFAAEKTAPLLPEPPKASPYRIQPSDVLGISVSGEDISVSGKKVDSGGNINLPMLTAEIHVAGLTVKEAQAAVENAYRDGRILRNPQVFVNVEVYTPREVTVTGLVKSSGKVQIPPETVLTLKEAISKCGGLQDTARGRKVRITRTLPDGTIKTFEKDVESAFLGKQTATVAEAHFVLEPGDDIYVPEKVI